MTKYKKHILCTSYLHSASYHFLVIAFTVILTEFYVANGNKIDQMRKKSRKNKGNFKQDQIVLKNYTSRISLAPF